MSFARSLLAAGSMGLLTLAGTAVIDAHAQQIYRIVGPDGRITFSDQPPVDVAARVNTAKTVPLTGAAGSDLGTLPFDLRQAATRFPVTLYTSPDCVPCSSGRALLVNRGVPFNEKTVVSNQDIEALQRLAGAPSLPFLTIGGQQIKGFAEGEWAQFLDAAGYPKTSQLPPGYVRAPATPMVAAQAPQPPRPAPNTAVAPPPPPPVADNPAGIRF